MDKSNHIKNLLLLWYKDKHRDLPWRANSAPYSVWISEIILQQTKVAQGLPFYLRFMEKFPDIEKLAKASEDDVLKLWQGLGYYSRARNLHKTAQIIASMYGGVFPQDAANLRKLPGIGDYTAAAISSICFNEPVPAIDGNVLRVIARLYYITEPIDTAKAKNWIQSLALELIDKDKPGDFNQAMMEFGAMQCVPNQPDCSICPLINYCEAYHNNKQKDLPVKRAKSKAKLIWHYYFIFTDGKKTLVEKRPSHGIWKGLYQFPNVEEEKSLLMEQIQNHSLWKTLFRMSKSWEKIENPDLHILSHRKIAATYFIFYSTNEITTTIAPFILAETKDLSKLPVSKMMENFLNEHYDAIVRLSR